MSSVDAGTAGQRGPVLGQTGLVEGLAVDEASVVGAHPSLLRTVERAAVDVRTVGDRPLEGCPIEGAVSDHCISEVGAAQVGALSVDDLEDRTAKAGVLQLARAGVVAGAETDVEQTDVVERRVRQVGSP